MNETCPCGSGRPYAGCCEPLHRGERFAATPEELMRSRYSAYAQGEIDYIVATQQEEPDREAVVRWSRDSEWLGLEVVAAHDDKVEFVARYRNRAGDKVEHREVSRFTQRDGRWLYADGAQPTVRAGVKIGRNDACPCGSGKKYKKCCGA